MTLFTPILYLLQFFIYPILYFALYLILSQFISLYYTISQHATLRYKYQQPQSLKQLNHLPITNSRIQVCIHHSIKSPHHLIIKPTWHHAVHWLNLSSSQHWLWSYSRHSPIKSIHCLNQKLKYHEVKSWSTHP